MVARQLITSALKETWPSEDVPVIFLGEWCKIYDDKILWQDRDYIVAPYHWDDREKLHEDFDYLNQVYESLLVSLAEKLNEIHETHYSNRYWRILIGQWLSYFIQILFDRWSVVDQVTKHYSISEVFIIKRQNENLVPDDITAFMKLIVDDEWNEMICGKVILSQINKLNISLINRRKFRPSKAEHLPKQPIFSKEKLKKIGKKFLYSASKFPSYTNNHFIFNSYLHPINYMKLNFKLGQIPVLWAHQHVDTIAFDNNLRNNLAFERQGDDQFTSFVCAMIFDNIPKAFLEGFKSLREKTQKLKWPKNPKSISTAVAWNSDTMFCFYAAEKVEQGSKFFVLQHGGNYGIAKFNSNESHQIEISDKFLTWGWGDNHSKLKPVGYFKTSLLKPKPQPNGSALLIQLSLPKQSYTLYSCPISLCQWLEYMDQQFEFVNKLPATIRNSLNIRCSPNDYGGNQKNRWEDNNQVLRDNTISFMADLRQSRLAISTYNSTTFIETLTLNFPTIIFWNPKHWELRPSTYGLFDELKSANIFHETPECAAKHASFIWDDINDWWFSREVQSARESFCNQFAATPSDAIQNIASVISE
jgi:putative transferase (TIGR04331 family)